MNWLNGYERVLDIRTHNNNNNKIEDSHTNTDQSESKNYTVHANTKQIKTEFTYIYKVYLYKKKHIQFGVHFNSPPK